MCGECAADRQRDKILAPLSGSGMLARPPVMKTNRRPMLYAILCYNDEAAVEAWPRATEEAVLGHRMKVQEKLAAKGKLGAVARLMPTTAATTLRFGAGEPVVLDGPFAETKEQLLGFYVVEADSLDEVIAFATELHGSELRGSFEIRPLRVFRPGTPLSL